MNSKNNKKAQTMRLLSQIREYAKNNCEDIQVLTGCNFDNKKCSACPHYIAHKKVNKVMDITAENSS